MLTVARYQVRGPHGDRRNNNSRWSVVDTADRDIAVDAYANKADATESARELNREAANQGGQTVPANPLAAPWAGETMPVPQRVNGLRVVAAIKLATYVGHVAHQWAVVVEDAAGFTVWLALYQGGEYHAEHGNYNLPYARAVERMVQRAADRLA